MMKPLSALADIVPCPLHVRFTPSAVNKPI
jgi:hypothetical protein